MSFIKNPDVSFYGPGRRPRIKLSLRRTLVLVMQYAAMRKFTRSEVWKSKGLNGQIKKDEKNYGMLEQALLKKARKEYNMLNEWFMLFLIPLIY
ncbi:MAG: hypothetical protein JWQ09_4742 [Segetibacter sp.]|nr:hypothetical protein [Segetibacter sp.]